MQSTLSSLKEVRTKLNLFIDSDFSSLSGVRNLQIRSHQCNTLQWCTTCVIISVFPSSFFRGRVIGTHLIVTSDCSTLSFTPWTSSGSQNCSNGRHLELKQFFAKRVKLNTPCFGSPWLLTKYCYGVKRTTRLNTAGNISCSESVRIH